MSPGTIALIVVAVSIAAWGLFMANVTIRRERKARGSTDIADDPGTAKSGETAAGEADEKPAEKPEVRVEQPT